MEKTHKKNLHEKSFRKLLANAPELEKLLEKQPKEKSKKLDRQKLKDKKIEIQHKNARFKELKRKHGNLTNYETEEYKKLILEVSDLKLELFTLSTGIPFEEVDLPILIAVNEYYIRNQEQGIYTYLLKHELTKKDYEKFKELNRSKAGKNIPSIAVDGEAIGQPGFYLRKLAVDNDPKDAALAACLGKLTNCCQSLSGELGQPCVIHGLTSPDGGFYVLFNQEQVVAQCWSWRSLTNAIMFDSIELRKAKDKEVVIKFFQQLAKDLVKNGHTDKVAYGHSAISNEMGGVISVFKEYFRDYRDYCDSTKQWVLYDNNYPFYFYSNYSKYPGMKEKTVEKIIEIIKIKTSPLIRSDFLWVLINWLIQEKQEKQQNSENMHKPLLSKLKEIAVENGRYDELDKIIETSTNYFNKELEIKDYLSKLSDNYLFSTIVDKYGKTPLHYAAAEGNEDIVALLIQQGAWIHMKDREEKTALHHAAAEGNEDIVALLIQQGAWINTKDE